MGLSSQRLPSHREPLKFSESLCDAGKPGVPGRDARFCITLIPEERAMQGWEPHGRPLLSEIPALAFERILNGCDYGVVLKDDPSFSRGYLNP